MIRYKKRSKRWLYEKAVKPSEKIVTAFILFLMTSCASQPVLYEKAVNPQPEKISIAVWDFNDYSPAKAAKPDLGELLSAEVIQALQKKGDYAIIERERLLLALEELHLGTTSVVDETARLKLGRMIGARWMVFGAFQIAGDTMRLDLRLVEVETGKVRKAVEKTASSNDLTGWLHGAREAAEELL